MKSLLYNYQGIIGAIIGTISTLITTSFLQKLGKISIQPQLIDFKYISIKTDNGKISETEAKTLKDANQLKYQVNCMIYNSSNTPKSIYDIKLEFIGSNKVSYSFIPVGKIKDKNDQSSDMKIELIELLPNSMQLLKIKNVITSSDYNELKNSDYIDHIFIHARKSNGKKFKKKLK